MKSPSEIAADAIRDELYARAAFARLITLPAAEFRAAVGKDPRAQTEFMARHTLDYWEDNPHNMPAEDALELIQAAGLGCSKGEPHMLCRLEKDLANVLRCLGRFAEAEVALRRAATAATEGVNSSLLLGIVQLGLLAFYEDLDRSPRERSVRIDPLADAVPAQESSDGPCRTKNDNPSTARTSPNVFLISRTARISAMNPASREE